MRLTTWGMQRERDSAPRKVGMYFGSSEAVESQLLALSIQIVWNWDRRKMHEVELGLRMIIVGIDIFKPTFLSISNRFRQFAITFARYSPVWLSTSLKYEHFITFLSYKNLETWRTYRMNSKVARQIFPSANQIATIPRYEATKGAVQPSTTRWIEPMNF